MLTRRVKKLSKERGLPVSEDREWNGYGFVTCGYYCDSGVYRDVLNRIEADKNRAAEREERRATRQAALEAEAERQRRCELETRLIALFPQLPAPVLAECIDRQLAVFDHAGQLPTNEYTARQWRLLGGRVKQGASPSGYVLRRQGAYQIPLYKGFSVEPVPSRRATWDGARLWEFWRGGFGSDVAALATAVRFANRLIKLAPFARHKVPLYEAKDRFIRFAVPYLREGRESRVENRACWGCNGTGVCGRREYDCERCDGSGVYFSRTLYEHLFEIDGEEFCFHSYVPPPSDRLSSVAGADLTSYGRRFTPAEMSSVRLRVPEFTRLIGYALEVTAASRLPC
jgi:hypothetical protein